MPVLESCRMEFASPEWFDFFGKLLVSYAAVNGTPDGVTCEVYRRVPPHLSPSGTLAWTRRVRGGEAEFKLEECRNEEADVKLVGEYGALLPLARLVIGDDTSRFERMMDEATTSGAVEIVRERREPDVPRDFTIHNIMAVLTR